MEKIYVLENQEITVCLDPKIIRVYSNAALWAYLDGAALNRFELLVGLIKKDYAALYDMPLHITNDSLIVEILVHVYCDYLGLLFNRYIRFRLTRKLMKRLLKRAEVVDCGESSVDSNRWVWDRLAGFKKTFIRLLPKDLNKTKLKTT